MHQTLPSIDFGSIRPFRGKQTDGFEELSVQLFHGESEDQGEFFAIEGSGGDGGVEAYRERDTGEKIGIQSKYWADRFHHDASFVIYDLETTGLYPEEDEFIQIAAVRYHDGRLIAEDSFFSFARPRRSISSFIESYTGIGNRDVAGAPRPEEVLCRFSEWAGEATLIAHNAKRFDSKFLAATCQRHGLPTREVDCIDSIHISKMLFGKTRGTGHSLDHVKSRLGLRETSLRRHDARGDVDLLGRAVVSMCQRLNLDASLNGVPRHQTFLPKS